MKTNELPTALLQDRAGRPIPLKAVTAEAKLSGPMADVHVEQRYVNEQDTNIEAVYTFPLPLDAVLLSLDVAIAGKMLSGRAVERGAAERAYEDAVTDGNSAVMLEEAGPGLYTASLGNLMAGESAIIRYRYALPLSWQGNRLRFLLPTTIAPRYGDAFAAGLKPHQVPGTSLHAEYPFELTVTLQGTLASAAVTSPSHAIACTRNDARLLVRLARGATLDRDFVLTLEDDAHQSSCQQAPDGAGSVAYAALRIPPLPLDDHSPLALKILIDCSGSMAGTSILQARAAALNILDLLQRGDTFDITLFGSGHRHVFGRMVPPTPDRLTEARQVLQQLDANMGGTEMEEALAATFALKGEMGDARVLLITDGEIHETDTLVRRAIKSGHHVFTVGVGSAVAESFLRALAHATGAACELVAPREGMSERILMQFHRMRQRPERGIDVRWPIAPAWQTPLPASVFSGDTLHVFAGFDTHVDGELSFGVEGGARVSVPIAGESVRDLARIAAANRLQHASEGEGLRLALEYQLLSRWTNYVVIAERADKASELPDLSAVPQMLAAGWGGTADIAGAIPPAPAMVRSRSAPMESPLDLAFDDRSPPIPAPRALAAHVHEPFAANMPDAAASTPTQFVTALASGHTWRILRQPVLPRSVEELDRIGLDPAITLRLRELVDAGADEAAVVATFLRVLSETPLGEEMSRPLKRAILKGWKQAGADRRFDALLAALLSGATGSAWNTPLPAGAGA